MPGLSDPAIPRTAGYAKAWLAEIFVRGARLLTARRIALHASILAIVIWSAYGIDLATPGLRDRAGNVKGADFLHFYIAGRLLRSGEAKSLYEPVAHAAYQKALLPESVGTYFVPMYGPQVYAMFEPLASLPYTWAALIWALINCAAYFACCYALWRKCAQLRPYGYLAMLLAAAYPGFFSLVAFGQSSAPALALFTIAYLALHARKPFVAGLAIGSLIYKPQLGLAAAVILMAAAEWKIVAGAVTAAVSQLGLAWAHFGSEVMRQYGETFLRVDRAEPFLEPKLYQMHSLRSFWMLLIPWGRVNTALYLISAAMILMVGAICWRRAADVPIRYAALLVTTVLVAPHLWIYDLVILVPVLIILGDWTLEHGDAVATPGFRVLLYACYALPLLGPLARFTRLQLSVLAFAGLLWAIWTASNKASEIGLQPAVEATEKVPRRRKKALRR